MIKKEKSIEHRKERKIIEIKTIEDLLTPEEINNYHKEWNLYKSRERLEPISHKEVNKINPEHVVISDVW